MARPKKSKAIEAEKEIEVENIPETVIPKEEPAKSISKKLYFSDSFYCAELGKSFKRGPYLPANDKEHEVLKKFHSENQMGGLQQRGGN